MGVYFDYSSCTQYIADRNKTGCPFTTRTSQSGGIHDD